MRRKDLVSHSHNGEIIHQRTEDGYVDASALCEAAGKEWSHFKESSQTDAFLEALSNSLDIERDQLVRTIETGPREDRGTWVHPQVAINLGQWLSPEFAVQVSEWVVGWMMSAARGPEYSDFAALSEDEKRIVLRDHVTESNKMLASIASDAGVSTPKDHAIFQSQGYKGMYGGNKSHIAKAKGLPKQAAILDFMGSAELAANLFRITQTGQVLQSEEVKSKQRAFTVHFEVGKKVRVAMIEISGVAPIELPAAPDVKKIKSAQDAYASLPASEDEVEVDLNQDLWKYALLVMVQQPNWEISTRDLIKELPKYVVVSEEMKMKNPSRNDSKFDQIVRNLKSHQETSTNFIFLGYAEVIDGGFRATEQGYQFVREYFDGRDR